MATRAESMEEVKTSIAVLAKQIEDLKDAHRQMQQQEEAEAEEKKQANLTQRIKEWKASSGQEFTHEEIEHAKDRLAQQSDNWTEAQCGMCKSMERPCKCDWMLSRAGITQQDAERYVFLELYKVCIHCRLTSRATRMANLGTRGWLCDSCADFLFNPKTSKISSVTPIEQVQKPTSPPMMRAAVLPHKTLNATLRHAYKNQ